MRNKENPLSNIAPNAVRVIPLGGLGEIGRNTMVYETADDMVVVDAGIMFPTKDMHGVDFIIADVSYISERKEKLRAYLITHGHEDHIGALPHILPEIPAPIYASRLANGLIETKLAERKIKGTKQISVDENSVIDLGSIQAEFFNVAHSIPDALGITLRTPAGLILHTGDFKIDHTPVMADPTDLGRIALYGREGVRLLCSDSTYADHADHTPSELVVGEALEQILLTAPGRVIIATFASQIARIQQIIDGAEVSGRTVFVTGRSMEQNVRMATNLNYISASPGTIRDVSEHTTIEDENVVLICTGAQGEPMSALSRMSIGDHRDVTIKSGDTVVFSSSAIPGNESSVNQTIDNLFRVGADVRHVGGGSKNVHVRGHAGQEELKTVLGLSQPKAFLPIHGEYRHLTHHIRLATAMNVPTENCHLLLDGAILELTKDESRVIGEIPASYVYVDGLNVGGVDHTVLRDRQHLANDGVVVVVVTIDHQTGQIVGEIEITTRGFPDIDKSERLRVGISQRVHEALDSDSHGVELQALQDTLKEEVSRFLYRETRQRPMVLPVAMEI